MLTDPCTSKLRAPSFFAVGETSTNPLPLPLIGFSQLWVVLALAAPAKRAKSAVASARTRNELRMSNLPLFSRGTHHDVGRPESGASGVALRGRGRSVASREPRNRNHKTRPRRWTKGVFGSSAPELLSSRCVCETVDGAHDPLPARAGCHRHRQGTRSAADTAQGARSPCPARARGRATRSRHACRGAFPRSRRPPRWHL